MSDIFSDFINGSDFIDANLEEAASPENLFSIFDDFPSPTVAQFEEFNDHDRVVIDSTQESKKRKLAGPLVATEEKKDGVEKISHITVERHRRKQMNDHLAVLKSLMPCFYVKRLCGLEPYNYSPEPMKDIIFEMIRTVSDTQQGNKLFCLHWASSGDQASIIGGVVDYINELQQVLQSLEAKKQRKIIFNEVLSPRLLSSPRITTPMSSPRKPPLSPRLSNLPISPRTPQQPSSPYKSSRLPPLGTNSFYPLCSPTSSTNNTSANNVTKHMAANSKSRTVDVEVKFSGPNLLLKTTSSKINGQVLKVISILEDLAFDILHVNISLIDDIMISSFTIKIGIECKLSADELAEQIQQSFC